MQQVKLPDVIVLLVAGTVVTKKMIQRRNALRKILIAYPVDHIQMLSSMKVVETKPVGLRICCCCCA